MSTATLAAPSADLAEEVLSLLHAEEKPITVSKLQNAVPKRLAVSADDLSKLLEEQVASGRLYKYQPYQGGGDRYWDRDKYAYGRAVLLEKLKAKELTRSALSKAVASELKDCTQAEIRSVRDELINENIVDELPIPPGGKTARLSAKAPEPQNYVKKACREVGAQANKLERLGVSREQMYQAAVELLRKELKLDEAAAPTPAATPAEPTSAASPTISAASLLDRIKNIEPDSGRGVTLSEIRSSMDFQNVNSNEISKALAELTSQGKVFRVASPEGDRFATRRPDMERPAAEPLRQAVINIFHDLLRNRYALSRQVPIHEIRSRIAQQSGETSASHEVLDDVIRSLKQDGYRRAPISNTRDATPEQLEASIKGMGGETHFFLEKPE